MNNFSIGAAWSHGVAVLNQHFMLLLTLVGGTVAIGSALQLFVFGINPEALSQQLAAGGAGNAEQLLTGMLPAFGGAVLIGSIIQSAGQFAAFRSTLSDESDLPGLLGYGFTAAIVSLIFWFVVAFVVVIVLGGLLFALGLGSVMSGSGGAAAASVGILALFVLLLLPLMLWLVVRLWVSGPAMADARSINPLYGVAQAWRLSSGSNQWPMLGYLLLLIVAGIVIMGIIGGLGGVLFGLIGGNVGAFLSSLLTGIPTGILTVALSTGVYRTLAPSGSGDIFA